MSTTLTTFNYTASIQVREDFSMERMGIPGLTNMAISSKPFSDYGQCAASCKALLDGFADKLGSNSQFVVRSEVNPLHTGTPTISKDWEPLEIARMWILDGPTEGATELKAVGQARIWTSIVESESRLN